MKPFRFEPALYRLAKDGKLLSLSGGYVDDFIRAVSAVFKKIATKTHTRFDMDE